MLAWLAARRKAALALLGAAATAGVAIAPTNKWVTVVVAVATALGVYSVPNRQPGQPRRAHPGHTTARAEP